MGKQPEVFTVLYLFHYAMDVEENFTLLHSLSSLACISDASQDVDGQETHREGLET